MKTKQLLSTAFFAATLFFSSSTVFAQVKIGAAPTTIGANSHLEVQAVDGNKTVIQKDNGNVGIGTAAPGNKLELNSGAVNTSGMRYSNLNTNSPVAAGATSNIGVDTNGDVVITGKNSCIPDYALAVGGAYTNAPANANITGLTASVTLNGIVSPSAGVFTLKAGNTYRLEGALFATGNINGAGTQYGGFLYYSWYNNDTNTALPGTSYGRSTVVNANGYDGSQPTSIAYITPLTNTNIALRLLTNNNSAFPLQYYGSLSYINIQQINPCK